MDARVRWFRFARHDRGLLALLIVLGVSSVARALDPVGGANAAAGTSWRPSLSRDGSRIAFESTARLSPDDTDRGMDVYVINLPTGTPRRLPRSSRSVGSGGASLSGDGEAVAYHVVEVSGRPDVQPLSVVLLRDLDSDRVRRIPPGWFGLKADGEAVLPTLGRTGRFVAFTSNAPGLGIKRDPPVRGVFLYEADTDKVRLISRNARGVAANRPSAEARVSQDGRVVAFLSAATNLDPALPSNSLSYHLYLADRSSGTVTRVDEIERGFDSAGWVAGRFSMDDGGGRLVFEARQRLPGKPFDSLETNDLFLFEASSGAVTRLTSGLFAGHSHSPAMSGNGRWTVFVYAGAGKDPPALVVYDRQRDLWRRVIDGACGRPAISGDGRRLAFESGDPNISGDKSKNSRIYVIDNPSFEEEDRPHAGH